MISDAEYKGEGGAPVRVLGEGAAEGGVEGHYGGVEGGYLGEDGAVDVVAD